MVTLDEKKVGMFKKLMGLFKDDEPVTEPAPEPAPVKEEPVQEPVTEPESKVEEPVTEPVQEPVEEKPKPKSAVETIKPPAGANRVVKDPLAAMAEKPVEEWDHKEMRRLVEEKHGVRK